MRRFLSHALLLSCIGIAQAATLSELAETRWPVGIELPDHLIAGWKHEKKLLARTRADVLVWMPPEAERIRALFLIPENTDSKHIGEHEPLRDVCAEHEVGIVYLRAFDGSIIERSDPPEQAEATFAAVLDLVAEATGIAEARHAPWITLGKSSRGRFPFRTTWWFPGRVIASISYHGETPTWPMADWSKVGDENVLHLAINGLTEWDGTWYRHVRPGLLNYQNNTGWLCHQMVLYGVGHGNYIDQHGSPGWGQKVPGRHISCTRVWSYIGAFIDRAMRLRVPDDSYPTDGPTTLKPVDRANGWLLHPRAPEELLGLKWFAFRHDEAGTYQIIRWPDEPTPVYDEEQGTIPLEEILRPASAVPEAERPDHLWLPDRELAERWLTLHDLYGRKDAVLEAAQKQGG
ncbi:MAG: hypothetical protein ACOCYV_00510 [Planctomycetota bacterium]